MLQDKLHVFCCPFFRTLKLTGIWHSSKDWNPESKISSSTNKKTSTQYLESGIHSMEFRIQDSWITFIISLHKKFLQFDWLGAVVFQVNLKYLHVKITNLLREVV